jgi:hypothetical protein
MDAKDAQHLDLHNTIDPDTDIGLLEFSKPQTTQAVNTPDSRRNKVDPNSDIGLLEFSKPQTKYAALPAGPARQHLDDY